MAIPLRVLIVEDSIDDCALMVHELTKGGFDVYHRRVDTREDMLEVLTAEPWDLILSDYYMPNFDAMQALETLRSIGLDLPFILVSGSVGEQMAVDSMRAGMNDYIFKDNLSRLCPAVQRELREAQVRNDRRQTREALYRAYADLERRVDERTEDLRLANARLSREIEERARAEREALRDKARLELAVRAAKGIYWNGPFDPGSAEGKGEDANITPEMKQLLGYVPDELMDHYSEWVSRIHPDDVKSRREAIASYLAGHTSRYVSQYRVRHKDGHYIWLYAIGIVLRDEQGHPDCWVRFLWDITERKQAEEALQSAHDELERRVQERTAALRQANEALEQERQTLQNKNIAMQEILNEIRTGKDALRYQLQDNLEHTVVPYIARLKAISNPDVQALAKSLEHDLRDVVSPFFENLKTRAEGLTLRESEICRHIKNGLSTKEIANILNISPMTIQKHRESIRRKLGIANEEQNLQVYLQQLSTSS